MSLIGEAKRVFDIEAQAILDLKNKLDNKFDEAVGMLIDCNGKVVVTGMGKSGQIARKIASTLSSTGTPAIFVHPAETSHGDLGVVSQNDVVLALSYGGETDEMHDLIEFAKRKGLRLISLTGNKKSTLALASDISLDVSVKEEACPLGLAPTASTTATLAMGDALAVAVLTKRGFKKEDFAQFHPGGSLGRRLLTRVSDLMHSGEAVSVVTPDTKMKEVISKMTAKEVRGVCGVVDSDGALIGTITDGDLRRRLDKSINPLNEMAQDIMGKNPKIVDANEMAERALFLMEQFAIQTLFVIDKSKNQGNKPVGLLHLQDILKARVR
ncbi:MAG: KpsF/GutQ family sugar-phosphate isomerase [Oligoflexia bacterium]|nr:KpsF/GutQ family sugar-phosphate isomerase [Oligoflexia bacterium]